MGKTSVSLYDIRGIVGQAADALYKHFGQRLEGIGEATVPELLALRGVGEQSARCVFAFFHEPAYQFWYNEDIRPRHTKKTDFELMETVLGKRIAEILDANGINTLSSVKGLGIRELERLEATTVRHGAAMGKQEARIKITPREARKIFDYFRLPAYEFHSGPKGKAAKKGGATEYTPGFPEEVLINVLGIILGEEVGDWGKTIRDNYEDLINLERFVLYHNQDHGPDEVTSSLMKIFVDFHGYAYATFDHGSELENQFYRDRTKEDVIDDPRYKTMLEKLRAESELFIG